MRWIQTLLARAGYRYQMISRRFAARPLEPGEIVRAIALRQAVFGEELRRSARGTRVSPGDPDGVDAASICLGCFDTRTNQLVGTMRLTPATAFVGVTEYEQEYQLHLFDARMLPRVFIASRLAVLPAYRGSPAAYLLSCLSYELGLGQLRSLCAVLTTEPALYRMYLRFGWRPCGRCFNSALGGYRVPMLLINHDYQHLEAVGSPFFKVARRLGFLRDEAGLEWARRQGLLAPIDPGIRMVDPTRWREYPCLLFAGMSAKGCRELLRGAVHLQVRVGDRVIAEGDGGDQSGVVAQGSLRVAVGERTRGTVQPGMIFGEFGPLLRGPRTADVFVEAPDTELIVFRRRAFDELSSAEDRAALWKNVAVSVVRIVLGHVESRHDGDTLRAGAAADSRPSR